MTLLNEIEKMQSEGKTEQEIISSLKVQGISPREIIEALSQSKIKEAVAGDAEEEFAQTSQQTMQPSEQEVNALQQAKEMPAEQSADSAQYEQQYQPQQLQSSQPQQSQPIYPEYQQYQSQGTQGNISPDTITEISEQVVTEKLSSLKKDIEKIIDLKTTVESKIEYIDERLKRIEKIIDRLNLSIMQKVGDYMTNIDDIKKELIETQKSFKALTPQLSSSSSPLEISKK